MRRILLASTSPFRRALLERLGLVYEAAAPVFDEVAPPEVAPFDCARRFAEAKAAGLVSQAPDAVIIGADQALDLDGELLRKPTTLEEAAVQLGRLSGRIHTLHSAIAVHVPGGERAFTEVVTVELRMRALSPQHIQRYLERDRPLGSAGGYLFEKHGAWLFDEVRNADETAIIGLPLVPLCRLLRRAGVDLLEEG